MVYYFMSKLIAFVALYRWYLTGQLVYEKMLERTNELLYTRNYVF